MELIASIIKNALMLLPLVALAAWCGLRMWRGDPILERTLRRPTPWGVVEIALIVLLIPALHLSLTGAVMAAFQIPSFKQIQELSAAHQIFVFAAGGAAMLLAAFFAQLIAAVRSDDWRGDLGWDLGETLSDLKLGAVAFALLAPATFGIQMLVVQYQPSKHPLLEILKTPEGKPWFGLVTVLAVVAAPLAEEILFRWLLQGWLQNFLWPYLSPVVAWFGRGTESLGAAIGRTPEEENTPAAKPEATETEPPDTWFEHWPIVASALMFALIHFDHGPDWIPLIPFSIGMGYLYYRTGRLLPSITVHFLLNGTTMVFMWVAFRTGQL